MSNIIYISKKVLPYVYIATHKITKHFYIGYREANTNASSDDIGKLYFTSSKKVKPFKDEFDFEVIAEFFSGKDAFDFEQLLITEHIKDEKCLNGYVNAQFYCGGPKSEEHKQKIGKANKGKKKTKEQVERQIQWNKDNPISEEKRKENGNKVKDAHNKKSEEEKLIWKEKISKANTGRVKTEEECAKISSALKGKLKSEEHRQKIGKAHRGKKLSNKQKDKMKKTYEETKYPKSKTWVLCSPSGELYSTCKMSEFCKYHNLAYSVLRYKAQKQKNSPVESGLSKGWRVLSCY